MDFAHKNITHTHTHTHTHKQTLNFLWYVVCDLCACVWVRGCVCVSVSVCVCLLITSDTNAIVLNFFVKIVCHKNEKSLSQKNGETKAGCFYEL